MGQLPDQVGEFARYLRNLLGRLDQSAGWCGVFWQRDPDGMRACLDGAEVPPWDVVQALLHDLAADRGIPEAERETGRARTLHRASLTAYDARPGARELLSDRLDMMLGEQRIALERQAELGRRLSEAVTPDEADRINLDLAWVRDDHERATARCVELRERMARLDAAERPLWVDHVPHPRAPDQPSDHHPHVPNQPSEHHLDVPERPWEQDPAVADGDSAQGDPAYYDPARPAVADGDPTQYDPTQYDPEHGDPAYYDPAHPAVTHRDPTHPAPAAPTPEQPPTPDPDPDPAPDKPERPRRRSRGARNARGARFAGLADVEPEGPPAVAPEADQTGPTPRGARYHPVQAGPDPRPNEPGDATRTPNGDSPHVPHLTETVQALLQLRGEARTGEAHAVLVEAAGWPAAHLPPLAVELHRAGLAADWATLLWEAASLPPEQLVALADALAGAGRADDCRKLLRQGVARPAPEIAEALLALIDAGREREARALLDSYLRVRTPEDAARCAHTDPHRLIPLLLETARAVSEEHHWDLVHALRVAGFNT
ncbi:hypothetical protein CP975_29770 [Streptomyces alboniger]|uniref:UL36 very large tegument protein n=1 Tax=Streptomyces alboniger TaxID=132473 RepID=A0A5J6I145_STRAD|nr:hypothetical protein CP975_29770 [Streptomyces alboniger]